MKKVEIVSAITTPNWDEPQLTIASRSLQQAVASGFKWNNEDQLWDKLRSEIDEFKKAPDADKKEDEFGDILHALVNIANFHKVDPQNALRRANEKFIARFRIAEDLIRQDGRKMRDLNLSEILYYWKLAKQQVKKQK